MTTETVSERVQKLAEYHGMDESAVIQEAVETGVETLYRDIVSRYLDDEITPEEAVDHIGFELVEEVGGRGRREMGIASLNTSDDQVGRYRRWSVDTSRTGRFPVSAQIDWGGTGSEDRSRRTRRRTDRLIRP